MPPPYIPVSSDSYSVTNVNPNYGKYGEKLNLGQELGKGQFGTVYGNSSMGVAVKRLKDKDDDESTVNLLIGAILTPNTLAKHTQILKKTQNASIRQANNATNPTSYTRLCSGVDIETALKNGTFPVDIVFNLVLTAGVAVLSEMHASHWYHCDIKPANIMLCEDPTKGGSYNASVVDFGVALQTNNPGKINRGSPAWIPGSIPVEGLLGVHEHFYKVPRDRLKSLLTLYETTNGENINPDKFALGLTLCDVLGGTPMTESQEAVIRALIDGLSWDFINTASSNYRTAHKLLGGRGRFAWTSTGKKVTLKDGSKRTLYRNQGLPGELRIRKMRKCKHNKTTAIYIKPPRTRSRT